MGMRNAEFGIRNLRKEKDGNPTTLLTRFAEELRRAQTWLRIVYVLPVDGIKVGRFNRRIRDDAPYLWKVRGLREIDDLSWEGGGNVNFEQGK